MRSCNRSRLTTTISALRTTPSAHRHVYTAEKRRLRPSSYALRPHRYAPHVVWGMLSFRPSRIMYVVHRCVAAQDSVGMRLLAESQLVWFVVVDLLATSSSLNIRDLQGAPLKNNPLGKVNYLSCCRLMDFFTKFTAFADEDSHHIRNKFRYSICYGLKITTIWT